MSSVRRMISGHIFGDHLNFHQVFTNSSLEFGSSGLDPIFKQIWKSNCQHKHIVFFWVLLMDRVSTRNLLRRRTMDLPSYNCELCTLPVEESQIHLFLECQFAQDCWQLLGIQVISAQPIQVLRAFQYQLNLTFSMDIIILMTWCIRVARNDLIFKNIPAHLSAVLSRFKHEFALVVLRANPQQKDPMIYGYKLCCIFFFIFFVSFFVPWTTWLFFLTFLWEL